MYTERISGKWHRKHIENESVLSLAFWEKYIAGYVSPGIMGCNDLNKIFYLCLSLSLRSKEVSL